MPKTVAAVRQKMLSAWDGVTSLHAPEHATNTTPSPMSSIAIPPDL